jgi:hypothetical protein
VSEDKGLDSNTVWSSKLRGIAQPYCGHTTRDSVYISQLLGACTLPLAHSVFVMRGLCGQAGPKDEELHLP